jgi:hypothetical protein
MTAFCVRTGYILVDEKDPDGKGAREDGYNPIRPRTRQPHEAVKLLKGGVMCGTRKYFDVKHRKMPLS